MRLLSIFFVTLTGLSVGHADLLHDYPQSSEARLNNGATVKVPVHYEQSKSVLIEGIARRDAVSKFLRKKGEHTLQPLKVADQLEWAKVNILFSVHGRSSVGPHSEFMVFFPVESSAGPSDHVAFAFVNNRLPIYTTAGLWNLDIKSGRTERFVNIYSNVIARGFEGRSLYEQWSVSTSCSNCDQVPGEVRRETLITSPDGSGYIVEGEQYSRDFNWSVDEFTGNRYSRAGAFLANVSFRPLRWKLFKNHKAVRF